MKKKENTFFDSPSSLTFDERRKIRYYLNVAR